MAMIDNGITHWFCPKCGEVCNGRTKHVCKGKPDPIKLPARVEEYGNPDDGPEAVALLDADGNEVMCQVWDEPTVAGLRRVAGNLNALHAEVERLKNRAGMVEEARNLLHFFVMPGRPPQRRHDSADSRMESLIAQATKWIIAYDAAGGKG